MAILTLTTDWGLRDHHLAAFKGELLSSVPSLQLIDISNEVEKFNVMQAAYIVQNTYKKFPAGSIHFINVSSNENCVLNEPFVLIHSNGQYLIGEDNGIFTLILGDDERSIVRLPLTKPFERDQLYNTFSCIIKKLAEGADINSLGIADTTIAESFFAKPTVDLQTIRGTIIYIDSFGNAVVNISHELFLKENHGRKFSIHFRKSEYYVTQIDFSYEDVTVGDMVAFFNQDGLLEIALNKESAAKLLGLKLMEPVRIEFNDSTAG